MKNKSLRDDIFRYTAEKYSTKPEYPWQRDPESAVLRHGDNQKWYGLVMNIPYKKLGINREGNTDVLNVKCNQLMIGDIRTQRGVFPAYHMNRANWVSVLLDGTADTGTVFSLLDMSFGLTASKKTLRRLKGSAEWLVPANPKYYDVESAFSESDIILWKQSSNIYIGDYIYLYMAAPVSAVLYKCQAVETDIPYNYSDDNVRMRRVMKIKLIKRYDRNSFTFERLKEYGIYAVRGPRSVPHDLSLAFNGDDNND